MSTAHGEDFQLEQLGRVALTEAELGAAPLEPSQALGLELLQRLALHQQPPGVGGHERPEAAPGIADERAQTRPRLQHGSRRQQGTYQLTEPFVLLDGLGSGLLEVGQGGHRGQVHRRDTAWTPPLQVALQPGQLKMPGSPHLCAASTEPV